MHIQTNRWVEERTGYRCVGCVGYDDTVYEEYTYNATCSEDVIVFDSPDDVPDEYSRPDDEGKLVVVSKKLYNQLKKKGSMRVWQGELRDLYKANELKR